ncbi:MAG: bifunctional diaminohydroxyphosphoribosylaminopyrimidine deaminase/5-amino-6-(5-phosphoribosylamino)uracil reductase RibD [Woeseia sp.]
MTDFTQQDYRCMARAMQLARRGEFTARPNPMVGCVLAVGEEIVGEGWHEEAGGPHAEVAALLVAADRARGATAYVTLEPCAHTGRTGPCADALITAGVGRVVAALQDPFPAVAGQGFAKLRAAGVTVDVGLMQDAARALNRGFLSRIERRRPFVRLKMASSLDGATAMSAGESQWITGTAARHDVQRLRALSGAVLTGAGTVKADDPLLNVRDPFPGGRQPLRVLLDSRLTIDHRARMLHDDTATLVFCIDDSDGGRFAATNAEIVKVVANDGKPSLQAVFEELTVRHVNDLLVEAGPTLAGNLLMANLVDELVIYQAAHIMGSQTKGLVATPNWTQLLDRLPLRVVDRRVVGTDLRITAVPAARPTTHTGR